MSNFEIIDRRGSNKAELPIPVAVLETDSSQESREWLEVEYMTVMLPTQQGPLATGRIVGRRVDGQGPFVVDYPYSPIWSKDEDWQGTLRKRLDTFLGCTCKPNHACASHELLIPAWHSEDVARLNKVGTTPLPPVIELLMRGEMAAQAKKPQIVAPQRG